jgi:type IV secretory pathway TraG/TraD family ATPase VirD4
MWPLVAHFALALVAGLAAAAPLARWRYETTPRRLGTCWLNSSFPRWSEGSDAIANANAALAKSISRTGRGIEIVPGVALSREVESRAILLVGDPGGGKTVALWLLILQLRRRPAHLIIHDVKGDLVERWPDDRFLLLAPHDSRSAAWDVARDVVGELRVREWAAALVAVSYSNPNWGQGAQEILVGVVLALQQQRGTHWGWADLKAAIDLPDAKLREFASRGNPAAARFLAVGEDGNFTLNAGSYISTLLAPINRLVAPLAKAWADVDPKHCISLRAWLDNPNPAKPTLVLQRAADLPDLSTTWMGAALSLMTAHLLATRQDSNPGDRGGGKTRECWFVLDELPQLGLNPKTFLPILETGRSLGLRTIVGLQNFGQLDSAENANFGAQLLQLGRALLAFHLDPGPFAAAVEGAVTKGSVRTWLANEKTGKVSPNSEETPILTQADLAELDITRDGAEGYVIYNNAAFRLVWPFPKTPKQREGTLRLARMYE